MCTARCSPDMVRGGRPSGRRSRMEMGRGIRPTMGPVRRYCTEGHPRDFNAKCSLHVKGGGGDGLNSQKLHKIDFLIIRGGHS